LDLNSTKINRKSKINYIKFLFATTILIFFGGISGYFLNSLNIPMAFLLGGFLVTAILVKLINEVGKVNYFIPDKIRYFFFGIIGSVIGAGFNGISSYLSTDLLITFFSVICLTIVCQQINYIIFRKLGHYDKVTAFFSATPGGLLESINAGERYGGDESIITIQHFLRIMIVVLIVPIFFLIFLERPNNLEEKLSINPLKDYNLEFLFLTTFLGLILGYKISVPARYFICPLFLSAFLNASGIVNFSCPNWLLFISQLVVGIALGARLLGLNFTLLKKCLVLSAISSTVMLTMAFFLSLLLVQLLTIPQEILFISFVPGGVTEMSLMAIVLSSDATFVTIHHIWRIVIVVAEIVILSRLNLFKSA